MSKAQEPAPRRTSEKEFQRQVLTLAHYLGWRCYHTFDSRRSVAGFPDLVLVKRGRPVIFAELKTQTGELTATQREWIDLLTAAGAVAYVWRPNDLNEIARILGE